MNPEEYYPIPPTKIQKAIICTPEEVQMWKDENLKLKTRITALEAQVAALKKIAIDQLAENNYNFEYNMDNIGKYFWQRDEKIQKKFLDDARRQLTEEHPEVDWK